MKCRIIVFDGADLVMHCNFRIQFFFNLSFQRLLWRFTRFDFSARKFLLAFVVTMAAGGRINFMFYMDGVADDSGNNADSFHETLLLNFWNTA